MSRKRGPRQSRPFATFGADAAVRYEDPIVQALRELERPGSQNISDFSRDRDRSASGVVRNPTHFVIVAIDLRKSGSYNGFAVKAKTIRTSLDIPVQLHQELHEAAEHRGCSARQLILQAIERIVDEDRARPRKRVKLPLVPTRGRRTIGPFTNDEAVFGDMEKR